MRATLRDYASKAKPLASAALETLFPARCAACREPVSLHGTLCGACWRDIHFIADPLCHRCGLPFEHAMPEVALCGRCMQEPPAFTQARAVFRYDGSSRTQILAFKYHDKTQLAPIFGTWLLRMGGEYVTQADAVIPVPLHYRRLLMRRYNQAALIARIFARAAGLPVLHSLRRVRATESQAGLTRRGREDNVRGAFKVPGALREEVRGKRLLLIDDVMTTGATLNACARALHDAGARDVYALTLARTVAGD